MRNNTSDIKRIIDAKNTQAYVEYVDGRFGFTLLQWIPQEIREAYFKEGTNRD